MGDTYYILLRNKISCFCRWDFLLRKMRSYARKSVTFCLNGVLLGKMRFFIMRIWEFFWENGIDQAWGMKGVAGWTYEGSHCQELRLYVIAILGVSIFPLQMAMNAKIWNWKKCSFEFLQIATMNVVCRAIWRVSTFITHSKLPICQNAPYWSVCSNQRWNALKSAGNPSTMLGTEL